MTEESRQDAGATEEVSIRSRGRLPHWERSDGTYFVTFRLADTLPAQILESWRAERQEIEAFAKRHGRALNAGERWRLRALFTERVDAHLDAGVGECWLRNPEIARTVVRAIQFFDRQRYRLHAWCVMPNHIHLVFTVTPVSGWRDAAATKKDRMTPLASILHSWKSYTAREANKTLQRTGEFWQREYYDHLIRDDRDFERCLTYTLENPVQAGLCERWEDWPWSGLADYEVAPASSRQEQTATLASSQQGKQSRQDAGATATRRSTAE